jgi:predicted RNA-binding protein Jag
MQEASTIAKAIEQGWIKAGKPKEFSVKVYEEPETNFLGFTKKNAKVAIFFSERPQGRDGHGRRPQKHMPQRRRFRHPRDGRRDDSRRDDNRREDGRRDDYRRDAGRRDEGRRENKWYQPQEERQPSRQDETNTQQRSSHESSKPEKKDTP